jgi:hypothetical protein
MRNVSENSYRRYKKKYFMRDKFFFRKWCRLLDNVENYCTAGKTETAG